MARLKAGTTIGRYKVWHAGNFDPDTKLNLEDGVPPGVILAYGGNTVPDGWKECNGQALSRTTYSRLFSVIGTTYGAPVNGQLLPRNDVPVYISYFSPNADPSILDKYNISIQQLDSGYIQEWTPAPEDITETNIINHTAAFVKNNTIHTLRFYNRALTDEEILQNYQAGQCSPLLVMRGEVIG